MSPSSSIALIMSGAFVTQELVAEFGLLPPAFLPLGVGRLYDIQADSLKASALGNCQIYLAVPESFEVPDYDLHRLEQKNVTLLPVPDDISLGEAIVYAINMLNAYDRGIQILHGDTVLGEIPPGLNIVAAHTEGDDYSWAAINHDGDVVTDLETIEATSEEDLERPIACGYFSFSNGVELVRAISQARGSFIKGLNLYLKRRPLTLKRVDDWYDFGHIQTYFRSRRLVTTARAFNSLQITQSTVRKLSADRFKMKGEANWFESIPADVQPYAARLLDKGEDENSAFYTTEYQYAPNLSELYVFSSIGRVTWKKILTSSSEFLELCATTLSDAPREAYSRQLMGGKTVERLERYASETGFDVNRALTFKGRAMPSLMTIAEEIEALITHDASAKATLMHGDFCFSNILYNSRNSRISVIDPRGYVFANKLEIWGDFRYDIAKFSHSVDGLYDFILAGRYTLTQDTEYDFDFEFDASPQRSWLQKSFADMKIAGLSTASKEIRAITTSLFVSMLPLHSDRPDRQRAFIANALRLYATLEGLA
ncbi:capsular biosynthesis protein [Asaia krungthepensis]|uniref:Capsular polysaccharide biosynthesis protein n=1 Tax=Asaia krungthepensis NRIC 0535 TaxID=1307925 RepID=A0ABQ0PWN1_9PROT|nr:capsular biosynthesis protein [Asaia krungthepensis]GBQ83467.1 capsular polysaccharide biosynthesis protein [Asaia krungthepensis NRIC 0535]